MTDYAKPECLARRKHGEFGLPQGRFSFCTFGVIDSQQVWSRLATADESQGGMSKYTVHCGGPIISSKPLSGSGVSWMPYGRRHRRSDGVNRALDAVTPHKISREMGTRRLPLCIPATKYQGYCEEKLDAARIKFRAVLLGTNACNWALRTANNM